MRAVKAKALRRAALVYANTNNIPTDTKGKLSVKQHPPKVIMTGALEEVPEVKDADGNITQEATLKPRVVTLFPKTAFYARGSTLRGAYLALKDSYKFASRGITISPTKVKAA